jgi:hypothetical protein
MSRPFGFWRRQFLLPPTQAQSTSDVLAGIALPVAWLAVDQLLLGDYRFFHSRGYVGTLWTMAYAFILTEVGLLGLWLLLRRRVHRSAVFFSGPLLAGWVFSSVAALLLLPISMVGLMFAVGILGLTPWLTAFSFFRNWKMCRLLAGGRRWPLLTMAGIIFAITPAILAEAGRRAALGPDTDRSYSAVHRGGDRSERTPSQGTQDPGPPEDSRPTVRAAR